MIPNYVYKLSKDKQKKWLAIHNSLKDDGEDVARVVANQWLTREIKKAKINHNVHRVRFDLKQENGVLIKRSSDGEAYFEAVLMDELPNEDGIRFTPEALMGWADYINKNGLLGDVDHEEYDRLVEKGYSHEQIKSFLKNKMNSISKALKAVYDQGKLWVRGIIDKRYIKQLENAKGLSLEALADLDVVNNVVKGGELLGFTWNKNTTPASSSAKLVKLGDKYFEVN